MDEFERVTQGPCEVCGEPGTLRVDPYALDVENSTELVYLCDACEQQRADDI